MILTCLGNLQKPHRIHWKSKIQPYLVHANVLGIMKMVLLNLTTLLMSNNITSKYIFRVLIQPLLQLKIVFSKRIKTYSTLEQLTIKAATKKDYLQELNEVMSFHASDFSKPEFQTQLELLGQMEITVSGCHLQFCDIHKCFQSLSPA